MSESSETSSEIASQEQKRNTLDDLRNVGSDKPLGYLSIPMISKLGENVGSLRRELESRGLKTKLFPIGLPITGIPYTALVWGGALYVYDEKALGNLLRENKDVLTKFRWPTEPGKFVTKVAQNDAKPKTPLYDLVADAFADYNNLNRLRPGVELHRP